MKLGLFGRPVAHSRSPKLFTALGRILNRKIEYEAVRVELFDGEWFDEDGVDQFHHLVRTAIGHHDDWHFHAVRLDPLRECVAFLLRQVGADHNDIEGLSDITPVGLLRARGHGRAVSETGQHAGQEFLHRRLVFYHED